MLSRLFPCRQDPDAAKALAEELFAQRPLALAAATLEALALTIRAARLRPLGERKAGEAGVAQRAGQDEGVRP